MAGKYHHIEKQIERLVYRLDKLEQNVQFRYPDPQSEGNGTSDGVHYCGLPEVPDREFDQSVSPHREELIRVISKKWVNGTTLRYYFFENGPWSGPASEEELVREGFKIWDDVGIGLKLEEVDTIEDAEVRIGFLQDGRAWSYVGRDVIDIPGQHERTMNFGWRIENDSRGVDVAVHEIGHTLGFPHAHQNPFAGIVWDDEAVYRHFAGPPNRWTRQTTFHNILRKLPASTVEGSQWDPNSIMHYGIAPGLILQPEEHRGGIRPALGLSAQDMAQVRLFYPPSGRGKLATLKPFQSEDLDLEPAEQKNFVIQPEATRDYNIMTFGSSDSVMVLFEDRDGDLHYVKGDDDSGTNRNAYIRQKLQAGKKYVLRIRLYMNWASGKMAVMMW